MIRTLNRLLCVSLVAAFAACRPAAADVLYSQPPSPTGPILQSSTWDPDGSDYDQFVWDSFVLPNAASITEVRWRGGYPLAGMPYASGSTNFFKVSFWASIPAGTQPDIGYLYTGPLARFTSAGNCSESPAGFVNGVAVYDYTFVLPRAFAAAGNTKYWVRIEAWQPGLPNWGLQSGTGGNGGYFRRISGMADAFYQSVSGDASFTLIGTSTACSTPVVVTDPQPVVMCSSAGAATFTVGATGTGTLSYRWKLNGNPMYDGPNGGGTGGGAFISGATTPTLTVDSPSTWANAGTYTCTVSNDCGPTTSAGAMLSFAPPLTVNGPIDATVCAGGRIVMTTSTSDASAAFQWFKDGQPVVDDAVHAGAQSNALSILNARPVDAGVYTCEVSTACATGTTPGASLRVCVADFTCDGARTIDDIFVYINAWFTGDPRCDVDPVTGVSIDDLFVFINIWFAGC